MSILLEIEELLERAWPAINRHRSLAGVQINIGKDNVSVCLHIDNLFINASSSRDCPSSQLISNLQDAVREETKRQEIHERNTKKMHKRTEKEIRRKCELLRKIHKSPLSELAEAAE